MKKLIALLLILLLGVSCSEVEVEEPFCMVNKYQYIINDIEYDKQVEDIKKQELIEKIKEFEENAKEQEMYLNIWSLARKYVGMPGDCYYVAKTFITELHGTDKWSITLIEDSERKPGDLVKYRNGGVNNLPHWAVYLGDENALHGNYDNTTIITTVKLRFASKPIYYRVK